MRRGDLWTVSGGNDYAGKPRPVVIVQDDLFGNLNSVAVCLLTTDIAGTVAVRPRVEPTAANGLRAASQVMIDKITAVSRTKLGSRIGRLNDQDVLRINRALIVFLGLGS